MFVVDCRRQGIKGKALENVFPKTDMRAQPPSVNSPCIFHSLLLLHCESLLPTSALTIYPLLLSYTPYTFHFLEVFSHTHTEQQHTISLDSVFDVRNEPGRVSCEAFFLPTSFSLLCIL